MTTSKIIVFGGGGHAKVVVDGLTDQGYDIVGVIDNKFTGKFFEYERVSKYDGELNTDAKIIIAIGDNTTRKELTKQIKHSYITVVHHSATVSKYSTLGIGSMILHGAIIQADSVIGNHVIINTGAQVDHDCVINDYSHIAPGAVLCGKVIVGEGTLIGARAVVLPGITIGKWVTVGAGSVITKDVPDSATVFGIPGKSK